MLFFKKKPFRYDVVVYVDPEDINRAVEIQTFLIKHGLKCDITVGPETSAPFIAVIYNKSMDKRRSPFPRMGKGRKTLVFYAENKEQLPEKWLEMPDVGCIEYLNDFHMAMLILACVRLSADPNASFDDLTDTDEIFYLSLMYLRNELVTDNPDLAMRLLRRAADGGNRDAIALAKSFDTGDPSHLDYD